MRVLVCAIVFAAVSASEVRRDRRIVIDGFVNIRDMVNFIQEYPNGNFGHLKDISIGQHPGYQQSNKTQMTLDSRRVTVTFPNGSLQSLSSKNDPNYSATTTETSGQVIEASNSSMETSGTEISQEEIIQIIQEIPVPYPVKIEKNVHYPVPVPYDQPVPIHVSRPYPIRVEKQIRVPVAVRVPQPIPIVKNIPVPIEVPVDNPVPYPVYRSVPFYIQKNVPYPVYNEIPMRVEIPDPVKKEIHVPVPVEKKIPLFVPKPIPYEIKIPIPKTISVDVPHDQMNSNFTISQASFEQMLRDAEFQSQDTGFQSQNAEFQNAEFQNAEFQNAEFQSQNSLEFPVDFTSQDGWTPVFPERRKNP